MIAIHEALTDPRQHWLDGYTLEPEVLHLSGDIDRRFQQFRQLAMYQLRL